MIKANDITRKSWIQYDANTDFPIQNIPFGVFKTINGNTHIGTIIGNTAISLSSLEELGYFTNIKLEKNTFTKSINLNPFLKQGKKTWRIVRDRIAILFDADNMELQNNDSDKKKVLFLEENIDMSVVNRDDISVLKYGLSVSSDCKGTDIYSDKKTMKFQVECNGNIFDDLSPIKVVSYLRFFFSLSSITSEKRSNIFFSNKPFNDFLSPFANDVIICS